MTWITEGTFLMGTDDVSSFPNERPAHRVHVEGFRIDDHDVTNAEFAKFVEAASYVTTAELKPDWEELKRSLASVLKGVVRGANARQCGHKVPDHRLRNLLFAARLTLRLCDPR